MHYVLQGDCLAVLQKLPDERIDAVVTDPPYGLNKEPDMYEVLKHWLAGEDYYRRGGGFMGKKWDSFVPGPAVWREVFRVLKPGGHVLAFFGTRTYHLGVTAMCLAGFEIRDQLAWMYGSGFPKSLNVGNGVGTALKPAQEPIVLARKPLAGTVAANVLRHGTGGLNVDGCRIEGPKGVPASLSQAGQHGWGTGGDMARKSEQNGRWPANVLLDETAAAMLDEQSGTTKSSDRVRNNGAFKSVAKGAETARQSFGFSDSGGASRFFYVAKASRTEREAGLDHLPVRSGGELTDRVDGSDGLNSPRAGAGRGGGRRNHHPTVKPVALMRYLCRLITPLGGVVLDPYTGSGTTGIAAVQEGFHFIGIELEPEYLDLANARISHATATIR